MEKALQIIKHYETLHDGDLKAIGLQPKMCPAGIWTVGYGRALTDPATGKFLKGEADKAKAYAQYPALSVAKAEEFLNEDYYRFELILKSLLKRKVAAHELGAMTSLSYNIGQGNFKTSDVLRYFNTGNKALAADNFKWWRKSNGVILPGLQLRRMSEAHLFLYNEVKFFTKKDLKNV